MSKLRKIPACQICKTEPAIWYMQDIAGNLAFYFPGYHIRGFTITKVCDKCKEEIEKGTSHETMD